MRRRLHLLLFVLLGTGCGGSGADPCRKACKKIKTCAEQALSVEGDPAAAPPEAATDESCLGKSCDALTQCVAGCMNDAPCEALNGTDEAARQQLADCKANCALRTFDSRVDGVPSWDGQGLGGDCTLDGCPKNFYCDLSVKKCFPGCAVDDQCGPGGKCNLAKHICCTSGESVCGGACANLSTSTSHCGVCGKSCPGAAGGHPVCSSSGCSIVCDEGRTLCGSQCVFTSTDLQNCGGCYKPCKQPYDGTATCQNGQCQQSCSLPGLTACSGSCVDVQTDPKNCGYCGNACSSSTGTPSCGGGKCGVSCSYGKTACGTQCVDLQTDVNNCGTCGKVCPAGTPGLSYAKCSSAQCGYSCSYSAIQCVDTCCDSSQGHCCKGTDSYTGKPFGYCLKYGYNCY